MITLGIDELNRAPLVVSEALPATAPVIATGAVTRRRTVVQRANRIGSASDSSTAFTSG